MFDFQDGSGPVPAHQHPNGGGWVADTASVDASTHVYGTARVFGTAQINYNVGSGLHGGSAPRTIPT